MAWKWWYSNTDAEYIFNYSENIHNPLDTKTSSVILSLNGGNREIRIEKADGTVTTALIKAPKKPTDTPGTEINSLIEFIMSDRVEEFIQRYKAFKEEIEK